MRVLVTGGSGFIGRNLVEHLAMSHQVLAPSHAELDLTNDGAVASWFRVHEPDIVIHAAVRPGHRAAADPSRQLWTNLRMFFSLLGQHERYGRLIFVSSGAVYDIRKSLVRVAESALGDTIPEDEHGLSKYSIARCLERLEGSANAPIELRLFGVYGPHEDYRIRFISNAICRALLGRAITLEQDRVFSYVYVDDLRTVVDWAMTTQPRHVAYNVVPPWWDRLSELATTVAARSASGSAVVVKREGLGKEYSGDGSRLAGEVPGLQFTPPDSAIDRLWAWYADRLDQIDGDALEYHA